MLEITLAYTPLHVAVLKGHKETAELLIQHSAEVNAKDNDGETPLHDAALKGQTETAELLIDKGADLYAQNDEEKTPLDFARKEGHQDVVEILEWCIEHPLGWDAKGGDFTEVDSFALKQDNPESKAEIGLAGDEESGAPSVETPE